MQEYGVAIVFGHNEEEDELNANENASEMQRK